MATSKKSRIIDARAGESAATGKGVVVAVIDSGRDETTTDSRILKGASFIDRVCEPDYHRHDDDVDRIGHGTICTNVLLDIAQDARVLPLKVFGSRLETGVGPLIDALDYAVSSGIRVINMSLGTEAEHHIPHLYAACERARRAGAIVVAPIGKRPSYPAVFEPVISVGPAYLASLTEVFYSPDSMGECNVRVHRRPVVGLRGARSFSGAISYGVPVVTSLIARWIEDDATLDVDRLRQRLGGWQ